MEGFSEEITEYIDAENMSAADNNKKVKKAEKTEKTEKKKTEKTEKKKIKKTEKKKKKKKEKKRKKKKKKKNLSLNAIKTSISCTLTLSLSNHKELNY